MPLKPGIKQKRRGLLYGLSAPFLGLGLQCELLPAGGTGVLQGLLPTGTYGLLEMRLPGSTQTYS